MAQPRKDAKGKAVADQSGVKVPRHCDDYTNDFQSPMPLRWFIFINRLPAVMNIMCRENGVNPSLFAKYDGKWYRVVMASRLGDLGITESLDSDRGYEKRVNVEELSDFTDKRPSFNKGGRR